MTRWVGRAARLGTAAATAGIVLAVLRFEPVYAEPPWNVRALPLVPWALGLAILAALCAQPRRRRGPVGALLAAAALLALALAGAVAARGPAGIAAQLDSEGEPLAALAPGPVDVIGQDLPVAPGPVWTLRWDGVLRVPESGRYRLWVEGRGDVTVRVAERTQLEAAGERLSAGADALLGLGEHHLEVVLHRERRAELRLIGIRGPRLRLGWIRPDETGPGDRIPPRLLGPPRPAWTWRAIDALALLLAAAVFALVLAMPWDAARALPAPAPWGRRDLLASIALYILVLAAMSWPQVADLAGRGVVDRTDGRLNVWILAWVAHALLREPMRLFDAPIFHPVPDTLALSENLIVPALIGAPASLAGQPVLGYNLALFANLLVSGLGVELLVRRATGDRAAARVGGILFAAGGFRWSRLAHLHAHATLFLPLALLALDRFWERRTPGRAALVGLALALQALSSIYLGAITATVLAAAIGVALLGGLGGRGLMRLAVALALAGVALAPLAERYLFSSAFHATQWSLADVAPHSATLATYVASGSRWYGWITGRHMDPESHGAPLFPGLVPVALGIAGLACAPRRFRSTALAASALAVLFSLGPETAFYRWLHDHVVLLRGIRALARFSVVPILALSVLAGFAVAGRRRLALLAVALALVEAWSGPLRLGRARPPSEASRWLAGRPGAVVYSPLGERDTQVMLDGLAHMRPLLNGYSGLTPRHYTWLHELLDGPEGPVTPEALRLLRAVGATQVVARRDLALPQLARFGEERVYGVPGGEAARLPPDGSPRAVLWTSRGAVLDLGSVRPLERIGFEIGEWPWREAPTLELSDDGRSWRGVTTRASLADAVLALMRDPVRARGAVELPPGTRARFARLDGLALRPGPVTAAP